MDAILTFLQEMADYLHEANAITVMIRILLAAVAGGLVGIEREIHGRAAGLRTHMLVALGAALSALIGVCLSAQMAELGVASDVQRTGAQVMSGIGFLGAGTILVKKGNSHISGLTTAAGLWATAAIGLAVGYGLYMAAFCSVLLVILAFTLVSQLEFRLMRKRQRVFVYLELDSIEAVKDVILVLREQCAGKEIQVTSPRSGATGHVGLEALIRIPSSGSILEKINDLQKVNHVVFALPVS
ncbi:MAG: MgtC/SapB family protein [Clostridia bacterium]|jgi:putative Mg2+ transporter-C (MgtC) family protein|nr:MgtC/SapB family protein [Clostridia bacterium]MBQ5613072.1 MgtC/SapB family protein [Clostridia bacterium]MBQ5662707.1 MgtC/SapB family protein [Clostridia bacterium]MBQ5772338.1 MgtC/SapB family protein [Clostridia bacterium]